jgi:hypothetical protein
MYSIFRNLSQTLCEPLTVSNQQQAVSSQNTLRNVCGTEELCRQLSQ